MSRNFFLRPNGGLSPKPPCLHHWRRRSQQIGGRAERRGRRSSLMSHSLLVSQFFSKNLYYKDMHIEQLFFNLSGLKCAERNYYDNRLSITKGCKAMHAEVQAPS